ncbi:MAG: hypothetical protein N2690_01545 [Rhodocyclaceae bacterium]|nr:hypothetical protein [Rhodocyclaceae bacterium]
MRLALLPLPTVFRGALAIVLAFALSLQAAAQAQAIPGAAEVRALGLLNGEALACHQPALVDRLRTTIVHEAPKTREIGEIYEAATSERFLALGRNEGACTDGRDLAERIEAATRALRAVFGAAAK